jgi:hypothetical protein
LHGLAEQAAEESLVFHKAPGGFLFSLHAIIWLRENLTHDPGGFRLVE